MTLVRRMLAGSVIVEESGNCTGQGDGHSSGVDTLYFLFISMFIGTLILQMHVRFFAMINYSAKVFFVGVLIGLLHRASENSLGYISYSIELWININPNVLKYIFLPILTFTDIAFKLNLHVFKKCFFQSCLLTFPLLTLLLVILAWFITDGTSFDYDWSYGWVLAATLCFTDPLSTAGLLKNMSMSLKVDMLVLSESHLGSIASLLMFNLFMADYLDAQPNWSKFVLQMAFLCFVAGLVFGLIGTGLLWMNIDRTSNRSVTIQLTVTIVLAYVSYLVTENNLESNGIAALFVTAIFIAANRTSLFTNPKTMTQVWETISYFGNTLIFMLAGVKIGDIVYSSFTQDSYIKGRDYLVVLVLYLLLVLARVVVVVLLHPGLARLGYGISKPESVVVSWAGLRGGVNLTLAIIFKQQARTPGEGDRFLLIVGGVVLFSLLMKGVSIQPLVKLLNLNGRTKVQERLLAYINERFEGVAEEEYEKLKQRSKFDFNEATLCQHITSLERCYAKRRAKLERQQLHELDDLRAPPSPLTSDKLLKSHLVHIQRQNSNFSAGSKRSIKKGFSFKSNREDSADSSALTTEVRDLFFHALRSGYMQQIEEGIIPKGSYAANLLISSTEFGLDHTDQPLNDIKYLHLTDLTAVKLGDDDEVLFPKSRFDYVMRRSGWLQRRYEDFCYREVKDSAFLATCLIDGHVLAEQLLAEYIGVSMTDGEVDVALLENELRNIPEVARVISESAKEINLAQLYLDEVTVLYPKIVKYIENKKIALIILEKQREYAESLLKSGLIDHNSHHDLLLHIRNDIRLLYQIKESVKRESVANNNLDLLLEQTEDAACTIDSKQSNSTLYEISHKISSDRLEADRSSFPIESKSSTASLHEISHKISSGRLGSTLSMT